MITFELQLVHMPDEAKLLENFSTFACNAKPVVQVIFKALRPFTVRFLGFLE